MLGVAMQILPTLTSPPRGKFWRWVKRRRTPKEGRNLKIFYHRAWLVETNTQSWGDDDARLYESDTALRKNLVGNRK